MNTEGAIEIADGGERRVALVTPEGFTVELPLASIVERLMALAVDLFLIFAMTLALYVALLLTFGGSFGAVALLGLFVVRNGYFILYELRWQGATPGKRLFGIRVVARDGVGLGVEAVIARNLLRDIELFLPIVVIAAPESLVGSSPPWLWAPALGWIGLFVALPFLDSGRQRAGDFVAGTLVVRVPRAALLEDEAAPVSVRGVLRFTREQLAVYGEHELETLADVLRQADAGRADEDDLVIVAQTIARKIHYAGKFPRTDPLRFLRAFYRAQRDALEKRLLLGKRKRSKFDD